MRLSYDLSLFGGDCPTVALPMDVHSPGHGSYGSYELQTPVELRARISLGLAGRTRTSVEHSSACAHAVGCT
jgi:hypothetical protein